MDRTIQYKDILPKIKAIIDPKIDLIGNMANITAILNDAFKWHWIGFYRVLGNELVLGPFQGPVACTRIAFGKGVCGTSWKIKNTIIVTNVHEYAGHIACSAFSNSEIVVPFIQNNQVVAVLDVDSVLFDDFNEIDKLYLEQIVSYLNV